MNLSHCNNKNMITLSENGHVTVETALILPIIILIISGCILFTIYAYDENSKNISNRQIDFGAIERNPCEVIRNTEYIIEVLDDLFESGKAQVNQGGIK